MTDNNELDNYYKKVSNLVLYKNEQKENEESVED